jgi:hypothetical protein
MDKDSVAIIIIFISVVVIVSVVVFSIINFQAGYNLGYIQGMLDEKNHHYRLDAGK